MFTIFRCKKNVPVRANWAGSELCLPTENGNLPIWCVGFDPDTGHCVWSAT